MAGDGVIDLPVGLAPWASPLAVLPSELALALAPWVGRLALAVGPLAASQSPHAGEPDGYSGLGRRGSYERLAAAEWGLADTFPEEFLRRAASGEHLFLDLARREPHGGLRSIAIVSAGPAQLGAPRLAQVASLIVLARRAATAGAAFCWGVLEDREHRLFDGLDDVAIQRLLGSRTAVAADRDAIQRWMDALGGDAARDFWFIGAEEDAPIAAQSGIFTIVVRDLLDPERRALELEIAKRGPIAQVRLDLPAPDLCARLLRDPYGRGGGSPRVAPGRGSARDVRFAPGARRVIVRLDDGTFESWPIPSSARDKVGHNRRWTPPRGHTVIAIGVGRRSVLAATATLDDPTSIEMSYGDNHRVRVFLPPASARLLKDRRGGALPVGTCALLRLRDHQRTDLVIDVLGHLVVVPSFSLWPKAGSEFHAVPFGGTAEAPPPPVLATAFFGSSFIWAEAHANGQIHIIEATSSGNQRVAILGAREAPEIQIGFAVPQNESWGIVAVAWDAEHRRVAAPKLPPQTIKAVVPVVGVGLRNGVPGLLTKPNPYRLAWLEHEYRELLPTAAAPIAAVAVCPSQPNIAWVTEAGELVVYSMQERAVLLRRTSGEAR